MPRPLQTRRKRPVQLTAHRRNIAGKAARIGAHRHDQPFNFSELNNLGANAAQGELLLFLNDDTEVISADGLQRMVGFAQLAHVGAVGAKQ